MGVCAMMSLCEKCNRPWYLRDESTVGMCENLCSYLPLFIFEKSVIDHLTLPRVENENVNGEL
jgi:hypothetical protein